MSDSRYGYHGPTDPYVHIDGEYLGRATTLGHCPTANELVDFRNGWKSEYTDKPPCPICDLHIEDHIDYLNRWRDGKDGRTA
jgi:hypothetical protein